MMRTPRPRQALPQKYKQTYPLHALQRTFLLSCSLVVFPLYRSSKETLQKKWGGVSMSPRPLNFLVFLLKWFLSG
uniref:Uncharacterized protein n=1 Tax=Corvus moneduloides TaxID=1196302 RepID=A0A8C3GVZ1_CORMO